jgi:ParB family chromosome partitioning protein
VQAPKSRLGKGMGALLSDAGEDAIGTEVSGTQIIELDLQKVFPNPEQPRKDFDPQSLQELSDSIKEKGVIQPIIVEKQSPDRYLIVAGERRYRAAKAAGLESIPAIVREYSHEDRLEIALIENIQREDLNAVEEAMAYRDLMDRFNLTQDDIAKKVGKNRATVANSLRLLKLPANILGALSAGALSAGHARTILSVPEDRREEFFLNIQRDNLSVRDTEALAKALNDVVNNVEPVLLEHTRVANVQPGNNSSVKASNPPKAGEIWEFEEKLIMALGTKVQIKGDQKSGKIEIAYFSMDDLERLYSLLSRGSGT